MHLLTVRGIPVRLHSSFVLLGAAFVGWTLLSQGVSAALGALALGVGIFGSVGLHELGHALAGRIFGVSTRDITLYPFGGIARMQATALAPLPEVVISGAGPAVNFLLAGGAWVAVQAGLPLAGELLAINLGLGIFNLLPAFPMDGGRVLRAVLSVGGDPVRATRSALTVGRAFAWLFVLGSVPLGSLSLALVGGFLLLAIRGERSRLLMVERSMAAGAVSVGPDRWVAGASSVELPFGHPTR